MAKNKSGLSDLLVGTVIDSIDRKMVGFLFFLFVLLSSDVFINSVLSKFKGAVEYKNPTNWGVMIQATILCVGFILVSLMQA